MHTSALALNNDRGTADLTAQAIGYRIDPHKFYPESFVAKLNEEHIQSVRRRRRADAEDGTPGERAPVPTWINEKCVRYRGQAIMDWIDRRTAAGGPTRSRSTA